MNQSKRHAQNHHNRRIEKMNEAIERDVRELSLLAAIIHKCAHGVESTISAETSVEIASDIRMAAKKKIANEIMSAAKEMKARQEAAPDLSEIKE